jgi:dihydrofolate reductase
MVMGRGTWDSIGRALPGRRTIVLTRTPGWRAEGAEVARSLAEALLVAGDREVFVVGGGQVYAQTIDHASRLVITEVHQEPGSPVRFPAIDPARWQEVSREPRDGFSFVTLERRPG